MPTYCYRELAGSPEEDYGPGGMKATRRFVTDWDDRNAVVLEILGDGYEFAATGAMEYPGAERVKAMRCRARPYIATPDTQQEFDDITSDINAYRYCELTVEYETFDPQEDEEDMPEIESDTFLTYRLDFGGEMMTVPGQALQWQNAANVPVPEELKAVKRIPIIEHHLSWKRVITPPWSAIRSTVGKVNNAAFIGVGAEQLLFDSCRADKEFIQVDELQSPQYGWRLDYVFRQRTITGLGANQDNTFGWNHFWRSLGDVPAWDRLIVGGNENARMYELASFSPLFQGAAQA